LLKYTAEYTCLHPHQRLLILRSLLELALNSEVMRDYALQKVGLGGDLGKCVLRRGRASQKVV
jgi:hypothetical protein